MAQVKEDKEREHRILYEIVVDAYDEEERSLGWYYYLEEAMQCPFKARCKSKKATSPLKVGEEVEVTGMAGEAECEHDMFVNINWQKRTLAVPLAQLEPVDADEETVQAIADWHYWLDRGYEF